MISLKDTFSNLIATVKDARNSYIHELNHDTKIRIQYYSKILSKLRWPKEAILSYDVNQDAAFISVYNTNLPSGKVIIRIEPNTGMDHLVRCILLREGIINEAQVNVPGEKQIGFTPWVRDHLGEIGADSQWIVLPHAKRYSIRGKQQHNGKIRCSDKFSQPKPLPCRVGDVVVLHNVKLCLVREKLLLIVGDFEEQYNYASLHEPLSIMEVSELTDSIQDYVDAVRSVKNEMFKFDNNQAVHYE